MAKPLPNLPWEVITLILDELAIPFRAGEIHSWDTQRCLARDSLLQCRLVSRSVSAIASADLFCNIYIDDEETGQKRKLLLQLVQPSGKSTGYDGIFPYIRHFKFRFAYPARNQGLQFQEACDRLSMLLGKLLQWNRRDDANPATRPNRLKSVRITFNLDDDLRIPGWESLPDTLRSQLSDMLRSVQLDTLAIKELHAIPPSVITSLQARTFVASHCKLTPLDQTQSVPPQQADSNDSNMPHHGTRLERLVTNRKFSPSPTRLPNLAFVLDSWTSMYEDVEVIRYHAPTLRWLSVANIGKFCPSSSWDKVPSPFVDSTMFPLLEEIQFRDQCHSLTRLIGGNGPLYAYHPDNIVRILTSLITQNKAPLLRNVGIEVRIPMSVGWKGWEEDIRWDYDQCDAIDSDWRDLDTFLYNTLDQNRRGGKKSLDVHIHFGLKIHYSETKTTSRQKGKGKVTKTKTSLRTGCFRKEEAFYREKGWPLSSVPQMFPRVVEAFPDTVSFTASYTCIPRFATIYEDIDQ